MKNKRISLVLFLPILLSGCTANNNVLNQDLNYKLLMPSSAPTLPLYYEILASDENVEVTTQATSIRQEFTLGNYDYLIFDSTNATKLLDSQENPLYEFKMMLTGGSFHLIGFNKTNEDKPTEEDNIYGFMAGNAADLLFTNIYEVTTDVYFDNINSLQTELINLDTSFNVSGKILDWAIISEPQLTRLMSTWEENGLDLSKIVDINLQKEFKVKNPSYEYDYIPQAALYVKKEYEENNKGSVETLMKRLEIAVDNVINHIDNVKTTIDERYEEETLQQAKFGFTSSLAKEVQENGKNGFGIVPNEYNKVINTTVIRSYLSIINSAINNKG